MAETNAPHAARSAYTTLCKGGLPVPFDTLWGCARGLFLNFVRGDVEPKKGGCAERGGHGDVGRIATDGNESLQREG